MFYGILAQLVEHLTFNQVVGGSTPPCLMKSPWGFRGFFIMQFYMLSAACESGICGFTGGKCGWLFEYPKMERIFRHTKSRKGLWLDLRDFIEFHVRAGNGSRTHLSSLGSWRTTDVRYLHCFAHISGNKYIISQSVQNCKQNFQKIENCVTVKLLFTQDFAGSAQGHSLQSP